MKFDAYLPVINGATDADPIAAPGSITISKVFVGRRRDPDDQRPARRIILALEGASGETVDVSLYALDEEDEDAALADKHWYLIGSVSGLAAGVLSEISTAFVSGGSLYARITAETVAANRRLLVLTTA